MDGAIFWLRVEYIGIPWIPTLWVLLGRRHFGLRGRAVFLSIIPVIVAIAEWTNGMHGLYDRIYDACASRSILGGRGPQRPHCVAESGISVWLPFLRDGALPIAHSRDFWPCQVAIYLF